MTRHLSTLFTILLLSVSLPSPVAAQSAEDIASKGSAADRAVIETTLKDYLAVVDARRQSAIGEAFHPAGTLMSVSSGGALKIMSQDEWWERVAQIPPATKQRTSRIVLIDVSGVAAVARIDITNAASGQTTTEYFNLQRTKAGWRIVNKILSEPL